MTHGAPTKAHERFSFRMASPQHMSPPPGLAPQPAPPHAPQLAAQQKAPAAEGWLSSLETPRWQFVSGVGSRDGGARSGVAEPEVASVAAPRSATRAKRRSMRARGGVDMRRIVAAANCPRFLKVRP